MNNLLEIPFYMKASLFIIGLYVFVSILYIGQSIIVPIIYATLFAMLLSPMVNVLTRKGLNRTLAIFITLLVALTLITLLFIFLSSQSSMFSASLPILIDKFYLLLNQVISNVSDRYHISAQSIQDWVTKTRSEALNNISFAIGSTISTVGSTLIVMLLIPVYVFMILFYEPLLMEFFHKLAGEVHKSELNEILTSTKSLVQSYLTGLLIEAAIVATLYSTGLMIIGIEYAILLGIIGALLNIVPYLGGVIAVIIYMIIAFTTKDSSSYVLWVAALFVFVHFVDNTYIIPRVVASKVKINALVAITAVLTGGAIWGVPGMFLSIPLTGVVKLVFDRIEQLKPWGYLLGDTMPAPINFKIRLSKRKPKQST